MKSRTLLYSTLINSDTYKSKLLYIYFVKFYYNFLYLLFGVYILLMMVFVIEGWIVFAEGCKFLKL